MPFRFKYFQVDDSFSTMKVGTDSMLLGAWCEPGNAETILDIGTGCGVLALMMAQKSHARVSAIEIHPSSVTEAGNNFRNSPWPERLQISQKSLQELAESNPPPFDLLIINPPFFMDSLKPVSETRRISRHESSLSHFTLVRCASILMHRRSTLNIILPVKESFSFSEIASRQGLFPERKMMVRPDAKKDPNRVLISFGFGNTKPRVEEKLTLLTSDGCFTPDYLFLTRNFHNFQDTAR